MFLQSLIEDGCNLKKLKYLLNHQPPGAKSFTVAKENLPPGQNNIICTKTLSKKHRVIFFNSNGGGTIAFATKPDCNYWQADITDFTNQLNHHLQETK